MPDNKNHESETIRQQRKAREDFLELKRMQSGDSTPPPLPSAETQTPKTAKEKINNFWFYNRWIVLGVVFACLVLAVLLKQCLSKISYDICITVYTSSQLGTKDQNKIGEYFEKIADDTNGDGEVNVQIIDCSYTGGGDWQYVYTVNTKLQALIAAEHKAMLFITDDNTYEYLQSLGGDNGLLDDTVMLGNDFYSFCEEDDLLALPDDLKLSRRRIDKTVIGENKTAVSCYETAGKIIESVSEK